MLLQESNWEDMRLVLFLSFRIFQGSDVYGPFIAIQNALFFYPTLFNSFKREVTLSLKCFEGGVPNVITLDD